VVPIETEAEIRRLYYSEHWPVGTVARQLDIHEDVVRRVIGLLRPRRALVPRRRVVDEFVGVIDEILREYPTLRSTRLYDMVRARGYEGSIRTLRAYVATVRPTPRHEAFLRLQPLVGEQAQIDWAYVGDAAVAGGKRPLWLFVIVLSWSRAMWGELVYDLTAPSVARSLVRAARAFGGVTRQWLFDNPKSVVLERGGDAARFHPLLVELSGHYRAQMRLCAPRKAWEKGRVERAIRYLRERFLAGRKIFSVEQGNRELGAFIEEIAHPRAHPTLPQRTVLDCFREERERLLPLPDAPFSTDTVLPVVVDKTAFVRFDTNAYSVPSKLVRAVLTLAADDTVVRVLNGSTEVARHARSWKRREAIEAPEHREEILAQKRRARDARGRDRLRTLVPEIETLFERWVLGGKNVAIMTMRTTKLLDLYGGDVLKAAVLDAVGRGTHDPSALAVLCEQKRKGRAEAVPVAVELGDHINDRDVVPHNLESYDAKRRRH
jgi:transposase